MEDIRSILNFLYGRDEGELIEREIEGLLRKYKKSSPSSFSLSEQDVLLITYADQVSDSSTSKASVLHQFLKNRLQGLITMVHLLPFYPYSSDDGFSVVDYYQVREDLGSWDEIEKFSGDFHLMFDAVINHMSAKSDWFQRYLSGDPDFSNYFIDGSKYHDLEHVVRPRTSPLLHDFDGKKVWTTFSRDQVDLNYENPKLLIQIIDLLLFYISKGAQLIRLDAIGFLWKRSGTTCIHLEETYQVIKLMRAVIEQIDDQVLLVSETNVPHHENISYFGKGDEAHMVYNFTLPPLVAYSILTGSTEKLATWAKSLELKEPSTCFFNFLSSHDGVGLRPVTGILDDSEVSILVESAVSNGGRVSYRSVGGKELPYEINCNYFSLLHGMEQKEEVAIKRMILAHAILLSFPGLPAIYFHSMFGLKNDIKGLQTLGYNRAINRQKFELAQLNEILGKDSQVLNELKRIIGIRMQFDAFHPYGEFDFEHVGKEVFVINRKGSIGAISCFFNLSDRAIRIDPSGRKELLTGRTVHENDMLGPYQFGWYL